MKIFNFSPDWASLKRKAQSNDYINNAKNQQEACKKTEKSTKALTENRLTESKQQATIKPATKTLAQKKKQS